MPIVFHGEESEFKTICANCGIVGTWSDSNNGGLSFRTKDGAVLTWWPKKGTVLVQGRDPAKTQLESRLSMQSQT